MEYKTGSALEGIIAFDYLSSICVRPSSMKKYYLQFKPTQYCKIPVDVIITGRDERFRKLTLGWLILNKVDFKKLIMFPKELKETKEAVSKFKYKHISHLRLTEYKESDKHIYEYLKNNCPNTEIILIEDAKELQIAETTA